MSKRLVEVREIYADRRSAIDRQRVEVREASQRAVGYGAAIGHEAAFDEMVAMFEARGLSPEAARLSVIGRGGSEAQARAALAEASRLASGRC